MYKVKCLINKCVQNINRPKAIILLTGTLIAICHRELALDAKFTANWFITISGANVTDSIARANEL
jgi:hypothetical protein